MEEHKKQAGSTFGAGAHEQAARALLEQDPKTQKLLNASRSLGNDEIQKRINSGSVKRDELLAFLVKRLDIIREAQVREMRAAHPKEVRRMAGAIADIHKPQFTKPEPTRWHASARLYEDAAWALCRGQLGRGAALVRTAMDAEAKAFQGLTAAVKRDDLEEQRAAGCPLLEEIGTSQSCGECDLPEGVDVAKDIQNVALVIKDVPDRRRIRDPAWTEDEEEEEEEEGDAKK